MRSASSASHGITRRADLAAGRAAGRGAVRLVTGIVCLRTKGVYFIMITLAFGQMAFFTASSLAPYGGDDGLTIRVRATIAGLSDLAERPRALLRRACSACSAPISSAAR